MTIPTKMPAKISAKISDDFRLTETDPQPYRVHPARGESPFFLISDHAGRAVPKVLGTMGLKEADWARHIAYDIGIKEVGHQLQQALGCVLIEQVYSRLVIDSNRAAGHPTSIPDVSDATSILGNEGLSSAHKQAREEMILRPYHNEIERHLKTRAEGEIFFVSLHSFTPVMQDGRERPWHVGVLHEHDPHSAKLMRMLLEEEGGLCVGDNEPYVLNAQNEYSVPYHAGRRGIPALEIEIRQDLINTPEGQKAWAERLARLLPRLWEKRKGMTR